MRLALRGALLALAAALAGIQPAAADEKEGGEVRALAMFIIDVETYKGQFYSVYNYCGPKTNAVIAQMSVDDWNAKNRELLAAQAAAEQRFLKIAQSRGVAAAAEEQLKESKRKAFTPRRAPEQLYRRLYGEEDADQGCAKLLGAMVSDSMSFQRIAPESYQYWKANFAKPATP